jgi:hypothetical protein
VGRDRVAVTPAVALPLQVAGIGQLTDDPMRGPLGDPDLIADLA